MWHNRRLNCAVSFGPESGVPWLNATRQQCAIPNHATHPPNWCDVTRTGSKRRNRLSRIRCYSSEARPSFSDYTVTAVEMYNECGRLVRVADWYYVIPVPCLRTASLRASRRVLSGMNGRMCGKHTTTSRIYLITE